MVEKTAAFRQRRAADTARWRELLHRGAAVYPLEVDGQLFDLMERFGGLKNSKTGDRQAVATALGRLLRRALQALLREEAASRRTPGARTHKPGHWRNVRLRNRHSGSSAFRLSTPTVSMSLTGSCFSSESARGPSIMGFEDEAEQSIGRPCRQANGRSKRTCELTSSIVPQGT